VAKVTSRGGLAALKSSIDSIEKKRAAVGFFDTSHYPDGTPVAYVATIQEFGHGAIPPRSFMRTTINEQREAWKAKLAQGSRRVLSDKMTAHDMLEQFGMMAAGDVKEKIISITSPALAESTIYARLHRNNLPKNTSTKPLVDQGIMLNSVDSQVQDK